MDIENGYFGSKSVVDQKRWDIAVGNWYWIRRFQKEIKVKEITSLNAIVML